MTENRTFTNADKLAAVLREIGFRKRVYPNLIRQNRMTKADADQQLAVMEAIADDYKQPDLLA